jgi:hypothetical protein
MTHCGSREELEEESGPPLELLARNKTRDRNAI